MNNQYISSITTKYGDIDNVKADCKVLRDIINRQGTVLLTDAIAEHVGETVIKFKLKEFESRRILESMTRDLREAILDRI